MPRADRPDQAEVLVRWEEEGGVRRETWATSFVLFWHDQFGTRHVAVQSPGEDLLGALHEATLEQLVASGFDLRRGGFTTGTQQPPDDEP